MEWISVKDRSPDYDTTVVAYGRGIAIHLNELRRNNFWLFSCPGFGRITHWLPLPAPPA
jgi:hypothetical protein